MKPASRSSEALIHPGPAKACLLRVLVPLLVGFGAIASRSNRTEE
jgi:hypothetical protein